MKYASRDGYQALLDDGLRDLRIPADDDARQGDDRRRRLERVGSANFDNRSFELNDELASPWPIAELAADADARLRGRTSQRSKRLTLDEWKERGILEKAREKFWGLFGEIF